MGEELGRGPIKIAKISLADLDGFYVRLAHLFRLKEDFERHIDAGVGRVRWSEDTRRGAGSPSGRASRRHTVGCKRFHGNDPRGDGGGEVFSEEGAERLVLPGLDVACGPVVDEAQAEDVPLSLIDRDGLAKGIARDRQRCRLRIRNRGSGTDQCRFGGGR